MEICEIAFCSPDSAPTDVILPRSVRLRRVQVDDLNSGVEPAISDRANGRMNTTRVSILKSKLSSPHCVQRHGRLPFLERELRLDVSLMQNDSRRDHVEFDRKGVLHQLPSFLKPKTGVEPTVRVYGHSRARAIPPFRRVSVLDSGL